jgi:hypothetical protein
MTVFAVLTMLRDLLGMVPQEALYVGQGATYAVAWWRVRCGQHAPCQVYLASCMIHLALALVRIWAH